jgi:hypothetical protein
MRESLSGSFSETFASPFKIFELRLRAGMFLCADGWLSNPHLPPDYGDVWMLCQICSHDQAMTKKSSALRFRMRDDPVQSERGTK